MVKRIILAVIGVILLVVIAMVGRYIMAYNGFLDKITARKPEMKQYNVIVLDKSEARELNDLVGKNVSFLKSDPEAASAGDKLARTVDVDVNYYDDIDVLVEALENNITSAIVLESERLEMLKEESKDATNKKDSASNETESDESNDNGLEAEGEATLGNDEVMLGDGDEVMLGDESSDVSGDLNETENHLAVIESFASDTRVIYTFSVELDNDGIAIPDKQITKEPFVLYISGSDSRTGIQAVARSDVNILAVVNPNQGKILLVSIPRDMYVQLHDTVGLKDKLTHAGVYGINMSKTTIEDFLGINIDYTMKVGFETVVEVVDRLDGIDIESDRAMKLKAENGEICEYIQGKQHVNGACALRFARERKSYETGDRHRGENQQQVIVGIIGRLSSSKDYLLRIPSILDAAADLFETTISRDNVSDFVRMQLVDGTKWEVESISVDGTGAYQPTYSMGANRPLYVMIPNDDTVKSARNKINEYLGISASSSDETMNGNVDNVEE